MLSPTQQSCAHRGEFFTVIALATPATFDVEDDEFYWMWKEGFAHEVVVCSRVKGTLRIALRNAARRAEYDRLDIRTRENSPTIVRRYARFIIARRQDCFVKCFFAASPKN